MRSTILVFLLLGVLSTCQLPTNNKAVPVIGFLDAFEDATIAQARQGYLDALKAAGYSEEKKTLQVLYRNAQGDIPTLLQATDYFLAQKVALIATCPTTATITALQKTQKIPVCMMVSPDPALVNLLDKDGKAPANLMGVYEDLDYIARSVKLIAQFRPQTQKLGLIYNQAEPQSVNALQVIKKQTQALGWTLKALPVNNSADTQLVVEALLNDGIDAFFAMPDNVVFASFEVIFKTCQARKIPVFTSEEGLVKRGAVAAYGANMYAWGYQAGQQTAQFLKNPRQALPKPQAVARHQSLYNPEVVRQFGFKIPKGLQAIGQNLEKSRPLPEKSAFVPGFYLSALMLGLAFAAMGLGIFITLRIFDIPDITTDGSYTLGGAITAVLLLAQWPLLAILGLALLGGALAGMITGIIHTRLRVNALLAGILVMTALYSVNLEVMGKSNLPLLEVQNFLHLLQFIGLGAGLSGLLVLLLVGLMLWGALSFLLRTDFGLAMRATGNAEAMIRANGVNTDRMKIIGLGLANALTALSGFLVVQYQGFADINMGIGIVIVGLGSVVIGETLSRWTGQNQIEGRILGVILGTIVFRLILALTLAAGVHPNWLKLLTSTFVLLVVALPNLRRKG